MRANVRQAAISGRTQVDRGDAPLGGRCPGCAQELLARDDQLLGAGPDALRIGQQDLGVVRQHVDQQFQTVHEHWGERLHPVHRVPGGDLLEHLAEIAWSVEMGAGKFGGTGHDRVGDQQLAARGGDNLGQHLVEGTLVGDAERADLLDCVTEEVHAHRVFEGGREDVDDAAADAEFAASLDQVDPDVGRVDKAFRHIFERVVLAGHEFHRQQVAEPDHLWLQHRTHRCHDHPRGRQVVIAGESPQHGQSTTNGVGTRAESLVRKRLPGRVVGDFLFAEQGRQSVGERLCVPEGRRDQQDRAGRPLGHGRNEQRPDRLGHCQVERRQPSGARVGDGLSDHRLIADEVDQAIENHRITLLAHTPTPVAAAAQRRPCRRLNTRGRFLFVQVESST